MFKQAKCYYVGSIVYIIIKLQTNPVIFRIIIFEHYLSLMLSRISQAIANEAVNMPNEMYIPYSIDKENSDNIDIRSVKTNNVIILFFLRIILSLSLNGLFGCSTGAYRKTKMADVMQDVTVIINEKYLYVEITYMNIVKTTVKIPIHPI